MFIFYISYFNYLLSVSISFSFFTLLRYNYDSYRSKFLRTYAIPYFFLVTFMTFDSLFNGVGANFISIAISILGIWVFRIPLIFIFSHFFGLSGIWNRLGISYILTSFLPIGYYLSGRWKTKGIVT